VALYAIVFAGVAGNVGVDFRIVTHQNNSSLKRFVSEANPVIVSVHWKLLT
jgi:hypothetical protein